MSDDDFFAPTVEADSGVTPSEVVADPVDGASIESRRLRGSLKSKLFGENEEVVKIGRFELRRRLGVGGMGVVYLGYDEDLSREVAIKLLRRELSGSDGAARTRLIREAQAMAKLSHPNVIPVFEVGTHEGAVFIAMEYVPGPTLGAWLAKGEHGWAEILDKFAEAGRGLAAAHARGLIHRDFKPENSIVGDDGRVRVMDFGLARPRADGGDDDDAATEAPADAANLRDARLTRAGAVVGTPAYMAPEQHLGQATDARTDEFSFCVSLFEALYGRRPFAGDDYKQLRDNVTTGKALAPLRANGPSGLLQVVQRGLSPDPGDRWPSMNALLDALERVASAPQRRRRNLFVGAAASITLSTAAWAAVGASAPETAQVVASAACVPAAERFAEIWNDAKRDQIAQVYATAPKRAQQWWRFESKLLDDWSAQWTEIYERSCSEEAEQDRTRFALRQSCLDQRMIEIMTRVRLLEELEPEARAVAGSGDYLPFYLPRDCENEALVSAVTLYPSDPRERESAIQAMVALRVAEGRGQAAFFGGRPEAILETQDAWLSAKEVVEASGFKPNIAEVKLRQGNGQLVAGMMFDESFEAIDEAIALAQESRHELIRVFAEVWKLWHGRNLDRLEGSTEEIRGNLENLERALVAVGSPTYAMTEVLKFRAQFAADAPDAGADEVLEPCLRANQVALEGFGEGSLFTARVLHECADLLAIVDLHEQAFASRRQAMDATDRALGPDSINLNFMLRSEVEHLLRTGDLDKAAATAERHVRVMSQHHDPADATMISVRLELARIRMAQGDYAEAGKIIESVAPFTSSLPGGYADAWTRTRLAYLAVAGRPAADGSDASLPEAFPAATELASALKPVIDGVDPVDAERELAASVEDMHWPDAKATALIQLGRLREDLGRRNAAARAYEASLQIDSTPDLLAFDNFRPVLVRAAEQGLARTRDE